jgi:hypothetical protein
MISEGIRIQSNKIKTNTFHPPTCQKGKGSQEANKVLKIALTPARRWDVAQEHRRLLWAKLM